MEVPWGQLCATALCIKSPSQVWGEGAFCSTPVFRNKLGSFEANRFRFKLLQGKKKKKGNTRFCFFFKGGAFEMGNMQKTWLAQEHEVFKMCWLPARELT